MTKFLMKFKLTLGLILGTTLVILLIFVAALIAVIDYRVTSKLDGVLWTVPAQIYSRPLELAEGSTVDELLKIDDVRKVIESQNEDYKIGVNGEILDGRFFPVPKKYRLQEGERVEIYNALKVDPKDNRKKRAL